MNISKECVFRWRDVYGTSIGGNGCQLKEPKSDWLQLQTHIPAPGEVFMDAAHHY